MTSKKTEVQHDFSHNRRLNIHSQSPQLCMVAQGKHLFFFCFFLGLAPHSECPFPQKVYFKNGSRNLFRLFLHTAWTLWWVQFSLT